VSLTAALSEPWEELVRRARSPVDVAILDSGIDATHPALAGRIASAWGAGPASNGATVAALAPDANNDLYGHGTAVASIVARLAPNARLHDVRVLGTTNSSGADELIAGLAHAVEQGWPVLNLSLAAREDARGALQELCERAYYRGQIVVAARRNVPIGNEGLPAELAACIGVEIGSLSEPYDYRFTLGQPIELAALGEGVLVAQPGHGWTTVTGTSFATPAISAVVAVLLGADPGLQSYEVKAILKNRAGLLTSGAR
jgi:subtilisin family serine protease